MHFDVFTLFPAIFESPLQESILRRALEMGQLSVALHNIRDYAAGKHRVTDDTPYGGGGGMVMKPEPIFAAVETVLGDDLPHTPVILTSPQGRLFNQQVAWELSEHERLAVICGRYLWPLRGCGRTRASIFGHARDFYRRLRVDRRRTSGVGAH